MGVPSFPISTNYFPLPSPIDIHFGKPYKLPEDLSPDAPDNEINEHIYILQNKIRRLIAVGIKDRRQFFDEIRKPLNKYFKNKNKEK